MGESVAALEDIRIIVVLIILVFEPERCAKRSSQLTDLRRVAFITMIRGGQVSIAELGAREEVLTNGLFSGLLPSDIDQKPLKRPGLRMPATYVEKRLIRCSGLRTCTFRKRGFRIEDGLEIGSQFTTHFTGLKRLAGSDGRVKVHDAYEVVQDNDS
jgi:hypothetical protein